MVLVFMSSLLEMHNPASLIYSRPLFKNLLQDRMDTVEAGVMSTTASLLTSFDQVFGRFMSWRQVVVEFIIR